MSAPIQLHEPPLATGDLPGSGGRLDLTAEHFYVDEVLPFAPSGEGTHWFVRLEKRRFTTPDAISALSRAAKVPEREIGSAGMKDKHAITRQWLSLPHGSVPPTQWVLPEGMQVLEVVAHNKKLRTGQLVGNHFRLRLVDVPPDGEARARVILARLVEHGLPNYFGEQRFGHGGRNLQQALEWLQQGCPSRGPKARFIRKLYPSVVQSELFNRYLTRRGELGFTRLLAGEVVRLDGSYASFVVDDPERELPRLHARDIHLTGPMPGPSMRPASGAALELERAIAAELGLDDPLLELLGRNAPGTRRDLLVFPRDASVTALAPDALELAFFLPSGSFATQLAREFTRAAWLGSRYEAGPARPQPVDAATDEAARDD